MVTNSFPYFASTVLLLAIVELEQLCLLTMNQIQSHGINPIVELSFLLEHQYSSCLAPTHFAFVEYPLVERFDSVDSPATPSD